MIEIKICAHKLDSYQQPMMLKRPAFYADQDNFLFLSIQTYSRLSVYIYGFYYIVLYCLKC